MIVWQANLGRGVPADVFRRELRRVLDAAGPRAVVGLQEIDEADQPDETSILLDLTRSAWRVVGVGTSVPILIPRHLQVVEERQTRACWGLAEFTPSRPIVEALLRVGPNLTVAVMNLHIPIDREQTQERRADCVEKLRGRARARKADGHAGVWIADTNHRSGWPRIVPGEKRVVDAGIDKSKAWAPPGRRVVVTDRRTVRLHIDGHDAHGARVMFERRVA